MLQASNAHLRSGVVKHEKYFKQIAPKHFSKLYKCLYSIYLNDGCVIYLFFFENGLLELYIIFLYQYYIYISIHTVSLKESYTSLKFGILQ